MLATPQCWKRKCRWYAGIRWLGDTESTEVNYCPAFPGGIPRTITYGNNPHKVVQPGQVGEIVFEKYEGEDYPRRSKKWPKEVREIAYPETKTE